MPIQIENHLSVKGIFCFNIEKSLRQLLKVIPASHLIGIERIIIVDSLSRKNRDKAAALYWPKHGSESAKIEISFSAIYQGMPKVLFLTPFIPKFVMANIIYHEIGHHHSIRLKHGISKREKEDYADLYKQRMLHNAFFWWGLVLLPFKPFVKFMSKNKRTR